MHNSYIMFKMFDFGTRTTDGCHNLLKTGVFIYVHDFIINTVTMLFVGVATHLAGDPGRGASSHHQDDGPRANVRTT